MKRPRRRLLLLGLLLVGFLVALYIPRNRASDADIAKLLGGPLLPEAVEVVSGPWHFWSLAKTNTAFRIHFQVDSHGGLDSDVVHCLGSSSELPPCEVEDAWIVGSGTPTETRLFDFLRTDAFSQDALSKTTHGGNVFFAWINNLPNNSFPSADTSGSAKGLDEAETLAFRERLHAFFDTEASRPDVAFREERETFRLVFSVFSSEEPPGPFKRAVGWLCDRLDISELKPVSDWASHGRDALGAPQDGLYLSVRIADGVPKQGFRHAYKKDLRPWDFQISSQTSLADAIRNLCEKHSPQTMGHIQTFGQTLTYSYGAILHVKDGETNYEVLLDYPTPRFRAFLADLLRLLANPPPYKEGTDD